jgi:transposase
MKRNDLSQSLVAFDQASTMVSVVELGLRTWLVAGLVTGLTRQPLKKLGADAQALLTLLGEATKAGSAINRICRRIRGGPRRLLALRVGCRRAESRPM